MQWTLRIGKRDDAPARDRVHTFAAETPDAALDAAEEICGDEAIWDEIVPDCAYRRRYRGGKFEFLSREPYAALARQELNEEPWTCSECGHLCQPGEGRVVYYSEEDIEERWNLFAAREAGWHVYCLDRESCIKRAEEARSQAEEMARREEELAARKRALFYPLEGEDPRPEGGGPVSVHGIRIPWKGGFTPAGTGVEFWLDGQYVWQVSNNGMDGDDWSRTNVRMGGARGIGLRYPLTEERMAFLREICPANIHLD